MRRDGSILLRIALLLAALALGPTVGASAVGEAATMDKPVPGLLTAASDSVRTVSFVSDSPDLFLTGTQSIHPQLRPSFKASWVGMITVAREGSYTFHFTGEMVLDGVTVREAPLRLAAGEHELKLGVSREGTNDFRIRFDWESDLFPREPVPWRVLSHRRHSLTLLEETARIERGRALVEELQCLNCHASTDTLPARRRAPTLTSIGLKIRSEWIPEWLESPRHYRLSAQMPILPLSARDREDVATFLSRLKPEAAEWPHNPSAKNLESGARLYQELGCRACHSGGRNDLSRISDKRRFQGLMDYLMNPLKGHVDGQMPRFQLTRAESRDLAGYLLSRSRSTLEAREMKGHLRRGEKVIESTGCVACHRIPSPDGPPLKNMLKAPEFETLDPSRGCLASEQPSVSPWYRLSTEDRRSIAAFMRRRDVSPAPVQDFRRAFDRLNCVACHEWRGASRLALAPNQSAPSLDQMGYKLLPDALADTFQQQVKVRPWLQLRMPDYGDLNMAPIVLHYAAQAGRGGNDAEMESSARPPLAAVREGVTLIGKGTGGMGCITCHDFRSEPGLSDIRGPELTAMARRLRPDWIARWIRDPGRVQPGTAMPSFFSTVSMKECLEKTALLSGYLSLGTGMPVPEGLGQASGSLLVLARGETVLLRTFMPEASTRSIAVGFPGLQNICFDAEDCRLAYAWVGDFIDASGTWSARGGKPVSLLGARYYVPTSKSPFQPAAPAVFKGYILIAGSPEFRYSVGQTDVKDRFSELPAGAGIRRRIEVDNAGSVAAAFVVEDSPTATLTLGDGAALTGRIEIPAKASTRFELILRGRDK